MKVYAGFFAVMAMVGTVAFQSIHQAPTQPVAKTTATPIVAGLTPVSDIAISQQIATRQHTMPIRQWKQGRPQPYYVFSGKKFQLAQQPNWTALPKLGDFSVPGTKQVTQQAVNRPQGQQVVQQSPTIVLQPQIRETLAQSDQPQPAQQTKAEPEQPQQAQPQQTQQPQQPQPQAPQANPEQSQTVAARQFHRGLDDLIQNLLPAELDQVGTVTLLDMHLARLRNSPAIAAHPRRMAKIGDWQLPAFPEGIVSSTNISSDSISSDGMSAVPVEVDIAANHQQSKVRRGMAAQTNERIVL
jgi:hypothetical protein